MVCALTGRVVELKVEEDGTSNDGQRVSRARVRVCVKGQNRVVLLLFYFRPSYGGPSIPATILAKRLILPMKIAIGF